MSNIVAQLRALSLKEKSLVALVALVLMAMVSIWAGLWVKSQKDAVIAAKQSEIETERERSQRQQQQDKSEQNRLAIEKNTAVSKAQAEELRAVRAELVARQAQGNLRGVSQQRTQEQREYEQKIKDITASIAPACERWLRACSTAKRLGLRATDQPCECTSR